MFIGLYCCLLVRVQPLSLAWWTYTTSIAFGLYFKGSSLSFGLATPYFIWEHQKFSPQQKAVTADAGECNLMQMFFTSIL